MNRTKNFSKAPWRYSGFRPVLLLALLFCVAADGRASEPDAAAPAFLFKLAPPVQEAAASGGLHASSQAVDEEFVEVRVELGDGLKDDGIQTGQRWRLPLPDGSAHEIVVDRVQTNAMGTRGVVAEFEDFSQAFVMFSTTDGETFGRINIPEKGIHYEILRGEEDGQYFLSEPEVLHPDMPCCAGPVEAPIPPPRTADELADMQAMAAMVSQDPNAWATIDVMVVYTPAARQWAQNNGGINNLINTAMEEANLAASRSQVFLEWRLVHAQEVNYVESGSSALDLDRVTSTAPGYMDEVHQLRDQYAADLVALFINDAQVGGIAWLLKDTGGRPNYGFSVSSIQHGPRRFTHAHEMGHNMGLGHHKFQNVQAGPGLYSYSGGWRWVGTNSLRYNSVMSYSQAKDFLDGQTSRPVAQFSNPNVTHEGAPTGHATDADNARTLRETKHIVAQYRQQPLPPAPIITSHPSNQTVTAPAGAAFAVAANGSGLSYQWQSRTSSAGTWANIQGATSDTFNTGATTGAMNGYEYRCRVANSGGTTDSNPATLTVIVPLAPPSITTHPDNQMVTAPAGATFSIVAAGSGLSYQWQSRTSSAGTWANIPGATSNNYSTGATTEAMNGYQYRCRVSNSSGTTDSNPATLTVTATGLLANGVPVAALSGARDSQRFFRIDIPTGVAQLTISISGGVGDADLYVRHGVQPTLFNYDHASVFFGNSDSAVVNSPPAGQWHIMLHGYEPYTNVTLVASYVVSAAPPTISSHPVNQTVAEPAAATFSVSATGSGLNYQWQSRTSSAGIWSNIAGATSSSYNTGATTAAMNGRQYRCRVSNNSGTVDSNPATLSVTSTIVLTSGMPVTGLSGTEHSEKFFRIDVPTGATQLTISISGGTGDADLYVRQGTAPSLANWDHRPFLSGNDETVTVNSPQSGQWYIMLQGYAAYSNVTLTASFLVTDPNPLITFHPGDQTVTQPNAATFSVGASGSGLSYQWQFRASASGSWTNLSGATSSSYTIEATTTAMNGYQYRCQVSNSGGTVDSNAATLTVFAPAGPTVLTNGVPVTGLSGAQGSQQFFRIDVPTGATQLTITTSGGTGDADLFVRYGMPPDRDTGLFDFLSTFNSTNEEIVSITAPQSGQWYIMLYGWNPYVGVTLTASFVVATPLPAITSHPGDQTVTQPNAATFSVSASGSGLSYQWQFRASASGSWTNLSGATSSSYTTGATTTAMNGYQYRCQVSNSGGTMDSNPATLTVNAPTSNVLSVLVGPVAGTPGLPPAVTNAGRVVNVIGLPAGLRYHAPSGTLRGSSRLAGTFNPRAMVVSSSGLWRLIDFVIEVKPLPGHAVGQFEAVFASTPTGTRLIDMGGRAQVAVSATGVLTGSLQIGNRRFSFRNRVDADAANLDQPIEARVVLVPVRQNASQNLELELEFTAAGFSARWKQTGASRDAVSVKQVPWGRSQRAFGNNTVKRQIQLASQAVAGDNRAAPAGNGSLVATLRPTGQARWAARLPGNYRSAGTSLLGAQGNLDLYGAVGAGAGVFEGEFAVDTSWATAGRIKEPVAASFTLWSNPRARFYPFGFQLYLHSQP